MSATEISFYLDLGPEIPNDFMEIARQQGESPETVCSHIQELRDMIFEQGECTPHRTDDEFLLKFLRTKYFKVDMAYKLLCSYYKFREDNPDLYKGINPLTVSQIGEHDIVSVAPYLDQHGHRIMMYKIGNWKTSEVSIDDIFRATLLLLELASLEPRAQVMGGVGIFDLEGLSFGHLWYMSPSVAQKIIALMVSAVPHRTTSIHILNQSWAFDAAFQVFKPFLTDRMKERIFIHGSDMTSLHKHIDPDHLPIRFGGNLQDFSYRIWIQNLMGDARIVKEIRHQGYVATDEEIQKYINEGKKV